MNKKKLANPQQHTRCFRTKGERLEDGKKQGKKISFFLL